MTKKIAIEDSDIGQRLDAYLAQKLEGVSRSRIKKLIEDGTITLNGKEVPAHRALRANDVIEMPSAASKEPKAAKLAGREDIPLEIVYDDPDFVVVNKASGLLVHPTVRGEGETLVHALLARFPKIAKVGESPERPGIVHRLDKEASGLMVVAKNAKAFENLKQQFQKHTIVKEYSVLVHGSPAKDEGTIKLAIGRAASGEKMAARHEKMEGDRDAVTHYRIEQKFQHATLLSVRTDTGRTHQIRAHFMAIGCPVVGDPLYHLKQNARATSPRLFLHARKLGFDHPKTGSRVEFTAPLPADLEKALSDLRP